MEFLVLGLTGRRGCGKDGTPYPVERKAYDEGNEILRNAIDNAKLGDREKLQAIRRLEGFVQ